MASPQYHFHAGGCVDHVCHHVLGQVSDRTDLDIVVSKIYVAENQFGLTGSRLVKRRVPSWIMQLHYRLAVPRKGPRQLGISLNLRTTRILHRFVHSTTMKHPNPGRDSLARPFLAEPANEGRCPRTHHETCKVLMIDNSGDLAALLADHGVSEWASCAVEYPLLAAICQFGFVVDSCRQNHVHGDRKSTVAVAAFARDGTQDQTGSVTAFARIDKI